MCSWRSPRPAGGCCKEHSHGTASQVRPQRRPEHGRHALSEAIDIIRASWAGQPFHYEGSYYQAPEIKPGPRPAHDIGLWLGVVGPRAARLVGAKADGWSVSAFNGPVERWVETLTTLYTDFQMSTFVFWPSGDRERQPHLFAEQVAPAVRKALAT